MEAVFLLCVALSFLFSLFSGYADTPEILVAMTIAGGVVLCVFLMVLQVALVVVTSRIEDKLRDRPKKVPNEVVESLLSEIEVAYQIALPKTGYNARRLQENLVELKESVLKQSVNGLWDFDVKANRIRLEMLQSTWKGRLTKQNTYTKITFADGTSCTCQPRDVGDMTEGAEGFTTAEVQMTYAEFEAMPEFQG